VWDFSTALKRTIAWYRDYYQTAVVKSESDLKQYIDDASKKELVWTRKY
jgi:hypothetical protein